MAPRTCANPTCKHTRTQHAKDSLRGNHCLLLSCNCKDFYMDWSERAFPEVSEAVTAEPIYSIPTLPYRPHEEKDCEESGCDERAGWRNGVTVIKYIEHKASWRQSPWYFEIAVVNSLEINDLTWVATNKISEADRLFAHFVAQEVRGIHG